MSCCDPCGCTLQTDASVIFTIRTDLFDKWGAVIVSTVATFLAGSRGISFMALIVSANGNEHELTVVASSMVVAMRSIASMANEFFERGDWT